jgi:tripartite-type tricarboxylate transporter receptor subunit TctC
MKKIFIFVSLALSVVFTPVMATDAFKIVVGLSPGGSTDLTARLVAKYVNIESNLQSIVENKPGGESKIAVTHLQSLTRRSDLAVLLSHSSNLITTTASTDLVALKYIASVRTFLIVRSDSKLTLQDVCSSKQHFNIGVGGKFTHGEIFLKMLPEECRKNFTIISYKSAASAATDLVGGHIDIYSGAPAPVRGFLDDNRVRILGSVGPITTRNVPVLRPDIYQTSTDVSALYVLVDKNMDQTRINKLTAIFDKVLDNKDFVKELSNLELVKFSTRQHILFSEILEVQSLLNFDY